MRYAGLRIVVVKDDASYAESLERSLSRGFPGAVIERVSTEHEFLGRLTSYQELPPSAFIVDVMLRWTDPAPDMPSPPEDVQRDGFYTAGVRCWERLRSNTRTQGVPVVFHTVLERGDLTPVAAGGGLPPHVGFSAKDADGAALVEEVRRVLRGTAG